MRAGLLILAGIALAGFITIALVLPRIASGEGKAAAAVLITGTDTAKAQVAAAAEKAANLAGSGSGIRIAGFRDAKAGEMKYVVEPAGVVRGWNESNAIEITLTPVLSGPGKVSWTCKGYPQDAMPPACGGK